MSALRISRPGYPTEFVIQEPAVAVVRGHGGAQLGWFSGTTLAVKPPAKRLPRQRLNRDRPLCGRVMATGDACARALDHHDSCRGRAWMDRRADGQRTTR